MYKYLIILLCIASCSTNNLDETTKVDNQKILKKEQWFFKDYEKDSIRGLSIYNISKDLFNSNNGSEVIVAVIDSELDIDKPAIKEYIWNNTDEIAGNGQDDDQNGYIDDINGWNFLATNRKDSLFTSHHEAVRILQKYDNLFASPDSLKNKSEMPQQYDLYVRASKEVERGLFVANDNLEYFKGFKQRYINLKDTLNQVFNISKFTLDNLDSLKLTTNDSILLNKISSMRYCVDKDIDIKWLDEVIAIHKQSKEKIYNVNYTSQRLGKDDPLKINDTSYGNNNVQGTYKLNHATEVSGLILSIPINISEKINVKLMPIVISTYGSEYDKDIALSIKYAVDNGAKVINMSIGKDFSLNNQWISDAITYAESNDVLIISAAGNESLNLDEPSIFYYPNDMDSNRNEIVSNFLAVGSSNNYENIVSVYSNYGSKSVDIFAPGEEIEVLTREDSTLDSGSSLSSAIVTGLSASIRSLYPNLSASEVKQIIMESGVSYDIMVNKPSTSKVKELVPFSSLSKSGKIVNAYNALLLAEKVSKAKKKK